MCACYASIVIDQICSIGHQWNLSVSRYSRVIRNSIQFNAILGDSRRFAAILRPVLGESSASSIFLQFHYIGCAVNLKRWDQLHRSHWIRIVANKQRARPPSQRAQSIKFKRSLFCPPRHSLAGQWNRVQLCNWPQRINYQLANLHNAHNRISHYLLHNRSYPIRFDKHKHTRIQANSSQFKPIQIQWMAACESSSLANKLPATTAIPLGYIMVVYIDLRLIYYYITILQQQAYRLRENCLRNRPTVCVCVCVCVDRQKFHLRATFFISLCGNSSLLTTAHKHTNSTDTPIRQTHQFNKHANSTNTPIRQTNKHTERKNCQPRYSCVLWRYATGDRRCLVALETATLLLPPDD